MAGDNFKRFDRRAAKWLAGGVAAAILFFWLVVGWSLLSAVGTVCGIVVLLFIGYGLSGS